MSSFSQFTFQYIVCSCQSVPYNSWIALFGKPLSSFEKTLPLMFAMVLNTPLSSMCPLSLHRMQKKLLFVRSFKNFCSYLLYSFCYTHLSLQNLLLLLLLLLLLFLKQ